MSNGVILRRQFRSSVDVFLELVAVENLLLDAEVLAATSDDDREPLVRLGRRFVGVDRARAVLDGLEDQIAFRVLVALLTQDDGRQVHRLAKAPQEFGVVGKLE